MSMRKPAVFALVITLLLAAGTAILVFSHKDTPTPQTVVNAPHASDSTAQPQSGRPNPDTKATSAEWDDHLDAALEDLEAVD